MGSSNCASQGHSNPTSQGSGGDPTPGIFETNERVASVDNDVADALSRMDTAEALRFPSDCSLKVVKLDVPPKYRSFTALA